MIGRNIPKLELWAQIRPGGGPGGGANGTPVFLCNAGCNVRLPYLCIQAYAS